MKLPGGDRAVVDLAKLLDYCLSPHHPRGRHKARVFASALGISSADVGVLREALLNAARQSEAVCSEADEYGRRFVLDFDMGGPQGRATVRSNWIVLRYEDFPRLTSCYVIRG